MKRRDFITLLGGVAAWPLTARAQQSGRPTRLGYLGAPLNNPPAIAQYQAFRAQLVELGFREGQNLTIDYLALDDPRGPFVAVAELMRSQPNLIVATGPEASLQAVVGASGFIPIVILAINFDPLALGYIPSLAGRAATSRAWSFSNWSWRRSRLSCSTRRFPTEPGWPFCPIFNRQITSPPPNGLQRR